MGPTAWVHKRCLEEYSNPTGDDVEEIAGLGKMIDVGDDDQYFVELEREEMESAELWERVIADLTDIEKPEWQRQKSDKCNHRNVPQGLARSVPITG
jgi:hypothetical protein